MINNKLCRLAFRARAATLAGLPALRAKENIGGVKPTTGTAWTEENYVPGTSSLRAGPAQGGLVEETGLYIIKWYEPQNTGAKTMDEGVDSLMALFTPGTTMALSDGTTVRVRTDSTVKRGQILPDGKGWVYCAVTIPWWSLTNNVVAP